MFASSSRSIHRCQGGKTGPWWITAFWFMLIARPCHRANRSHVDSVCFGPGTPSAIVVAPVGNSFFSAVTPLM